MDSKICNMKFF